MSDQPEKPKAAEQFQLVRQVGSPDKLTLKRGKSEYQIEKAEYVYFLEPNDDASAPGDWRTVKCADYHGEHFVFLEPTYNVLPQHVDPNKMDTGRGKWFAMCTCGSPAVIVGPAEARKEESNLAEQLLVCLYYHHTLTEYGFGNHADQEDRREWR